MFKRHASASVWCEVSMLQVRPPAAAAFQSGPNDNSDPKQQPEAGTVDLRASSQQRAPQVSLMSKH